MRGLLLFGSRRHVKRTGSAQAAGDPGGSKPRASPSQWYVLLAHFPPWQGRDGCRLVFVCNDKTSSSGCQSSTDGVACRFLEALTFPSLCVLLGSGVMAVVNGDQDLSWIVQSQSLPAV